MSSISSTNAVSPARSSPQDFGSDSGSAFSCFSTAGNEIIANVQENRDQEGNSRSQSPDPSTASAEQRHIPASDGDNDDALSSVSQTTAVLTTSRLDVGTRVQARAREIEEVLSRFCLDAGNRIPVNARHFIMARVFELVELCSDLGAGAASERGAVLALKDQLVETRGENTALHQRAILAESRSCLLPPVLAANDAATAAFPPSQPDHPAALLQRSVPGPPRQPAPRTPLAHLRDAAERDVRSSNTSGLPSTWRLSRRSAPSTTPARDTLRLIKANIDPVEKDIKRRDVAPHPAMMVEVDPQAFACNPTASTAVCRMDFHQAVRIYTSLRARFVPSTDTAEACPVRDDAARAVCTRCGTEGHLGTDCAVRMGGPRRHLRRMPPGRIGGQRPSYKAPPVSALVDRVSRLRARLTRAEFSANPSAARGSTVNMDYARRAPSRCFRPIQTIWGRVPALPQDYTSYSIADDSSAMIVTRKPPFDVCPLLVSKNVVAIYCEGPTFTFIFVSMYAPPHSPLENVLEELTNVLSLSRLHWHNALLPLNDAESLPTYETPYTASWIDLTLAKPSVVSTAFRWTVHDDTTYSEHRLVEVRIGLHLSRDAANSLCPTRTVACTSGAPLVRSGFGRVPGRSAVAAKRRRFQRARDPTMRTFYRGEYTAALSIYRQNIEEARDQHIRGYALSCVQRSLFAAPFKAAFGRLHQYRCLLSLLAPYGTCTTTHLESAALLRRTQTAVDDPATDAQVHTVTRALATSPYNTPLQDVPFSHEEVVDVLRRTPNNSAAGPDNSTPLMMKALCRYHPDFLLMIFNAALSLGYFPCCWRRARVTFIHKPGRPPERTSSYRPICVSSVSGKKLERLLNGRLHSVMALHDLKDQLLRFRNACTPAILISVDFHGAFDSVWHPYVLRYFRERLLHSKLYHLLRTFLEERTVFLRSHAGQVEASPSLSSPQGRTQMTPVILLPAATTAALSELTLEVLRRVRLWADSVKVSLNRDKTFCVLFHHGARGVARTRITVVLPALTYASPIWWSESRVDCRLYARIVSIQRVALLAIPRAFRTTNPRLCRRYVAFSALRFRPEWVALPHKDVVQHPSLPAIAPFRRLSRHAACNACRVPGIPIYTDGSYTNLSAGAAYVVFDPKQTACRCFRRRFTQNAEPHVMEIRRLLNTVRRRSPVHLYHVPGHAGVFGNEVADYLSQRATRVGLRRIPSPFRVVRRQFRQELLAMWNDSWRADFRRTELHRWVQDLRDMPSFFPPPQPLVTLVTGHGRFPNTSTGSA
ncbi:hypothetical protein HPB52_024299 [Rhipicephalus sanguineus]|uniref:CCHC-type domain-containing protein n=1 Tax=Rhipicephalus sanguineus TaxID=34632 RepID=A0A9D4PBV1_RHISA|nr:hypothetical protein HPB52_024299 [Rhipicephalus sanguineus]